MKKNIAFRFLNKYVLLTIISLFLILVVSWAFESSFLELMFMNYNAEDLSGDPSEIKRAFLKTIYNWERLIDSAMFHLVYFFPIFTTIPVIPFLSELNSYFIYGATRFEHYNKSLFKTTLCYALIAGVTIATTFSIFLTLGSIVMVPTIDNIGGFSSALPDGFYPNHPYLFFMFMTWTIYFAFTFSFALLGCGVALWKRQIYYVLMIPMLYYYLANHISASFNGFLPLHVSACIVAFNTLYTTFETFVPLILVLILALILIVTGIKKQRQLIG